MTASGPFWNISTRILQMQISITFSIYIVFSAFYRSFCLKYCQHGIHNLSKKTQSCAYWDVPINMPSILRLYIHIKALDKRHHATHGALMYKRWRILATDFVYITLYEWLWDVQNMVIREVLRMNIKSSMKKQWHMKLSNC